jgi:hypothetical protein
VDYQLEVSKRILLDHIATGRPMTEGGVGGFGLPVRVMDNDTTSTAN